MSQSERLRQANLGGWQLEGIQNKQTNQKQIIWQLKNKESEERVKKCVVLV